jgi:hypothetical protein
MWLLIVQLTGYGRGTHIASSRDAAGGWSWRAMGHRACLVGIDWGGGRVRDRVEVCCYAGGRGDETPKAVLLGGREVAVRVERSWIKEPVGAGGTARRRRMFQVRLEDGGRCRLAQEPDGSWTLARAESGR